MNKSSNLRKKSELLKLTDVLHLYLFTLDPFQAEEEFEK